MPVTYTYMRLEDIPAGATVDVQRDIPPHLREAFYRRLGLSVSKAADLAAFDNGTFRPDYRGDRLPKTPRNPLRPLQRRRKRERG